MEEISIGNETCRAVVLPYGATLAEVHVMDRNGVLGNVVLGLEDWKSESNPCMNCVIGRTAGRMAPVVEVEGSTYDLPGCDGGGGGINPSTCLHGGMAWNSTSWRVVETDAASATLEHVDAAGPFPGELTARVTYAIRGTTLSMRYEATSTATTPASLTNHAYWNLSAGAEPTVGSHTLQLLCDAYRPDDGSGDGLPTGARASVEGTARDARAAVRLGDFIEAQKSLSPLWPHGEEFEVTSNRGTDPNASAPALAAVLSHPGSGRVMTVHTTEPAIQTYYATLLAGTAGPGGAALATHGGVCLEAQRHANAEAVGAPSRLLKPGETYRQQTTHVFTTD